MKKILYISAFVPNKDAGHAGGRVAYENLTHLRSQGAVTAIACTSEDVSKHLDPGIQCVQQSKAGFLRYLVANATSLKPRTVLTAPVLHTRLNAAAQQALIERLREDLYDEVFVDFTQCLLLALLAVSKSGTKPRVTACLHDVFVQRIIRSRSLMDAALAGWICREEREMLEAVDSILVLSMKDRDLVKSLYAVPHAAVKPFLPPGWAANVTRSQASIDPGMLVFFGNFDRHENASAAEWFTTVTLPIIRAEVPGVSLKLVGTGSERLATRLAAPGVTGTGFVEDPSEFFSQCAYAVAPLFEGAGVKFKVLEALACGVPVLGTSVACEGIPDQPLLHLVNSNNFAAETVRLLRAPDPSVAAK